MSDTRQPRPLPALEAAHRAALGTDDPEAARKALRDLEALLGANDDHAARALFTALCQMEDEGCGR